MWLKSQTPGQGRASKPPLPLISIPLLHAPQVRIVLITLYDLYTVFVNHPLFFRHLAQC